MDALGDLPLDAADQARGVARGIGVGGEAPEGVIGRADRVPERVGDRGDQTGRVRLDALGVAERVGDRYQASLGVVLPDGPGAGGVGGGEEVAGRVVGEGRQDGIAAGDGRDLAQVGVGEGDGATVGFDHVGGVAVVVELEPGSPADLVRPGNNAALFVVLGHRGIPERVHDLANLVLLVVVVLGGVPQAVDSGGHRAGGVVVEGGGQVPVLADALNYPALSVVDVLVVLTVPVDPGGIWPASSYS